MRDDWRAFTRAYVPKVFADGMTSERHELIDELDRIMRTGAPRVMLLTGPPGIGKSALLADFEGPVAGFGGHVARGKFDSFRDQPYAAFVEAFTNLVDQLLTEGEDELEEWRETLGEALGNLAAVIIDPPRKMRSPRHVRS